ncbi:MAG: hypothetical protein RBT73_03405 [Spirochaetia bacterium]|jgi:nickel-dependent lactate racemase|nr:hypothetical protein [Spirochaetia bacterium]
MYFAPIRRKARITIASASGYPRDINLYQAQKALDHADKATEDGGTIIIVAECRDSYGDKIFETYMKSGYTAQGIIEEIKNNFIIGGHKAYGFAKVALKKRVIFVNDLSELIVTSLFARKAKTMEEAVAMALKDQGPSAEFLIMPEGSITVPHENYVN